MQSTPLSHILLVVDLQDSLRHEPEYSRITRYISEHASEYSRVIHTVFACPRGINENYEKYLGYTDDGMPVEEIQKNHNDPDTIVKFSYEIPGDICDFSSPGYLPTMAEYDVIGCNIESNVMAVSFQLFDHGYDFRILTDYCYSLNGTAVANAAVLVMKNAFGSAVVE